MTRKNPWTNPKDRDAIMAGIKLASSKKRGSVMADRFAAQWAKDIADMRHKGRRIGTLWINDNEMTGDATLTGPFLNMSALERADVLIDVIGVLQREYQLAVAGLFQTPVD
ncbi:hypothetical protein UFOVP1204_38 [uncultured Caudovirales phage]|uniref:Uncharacterized protein n=1 Tax=uncultured Caudovirales phage TaxID=2100421 RepID=A0A6J5PY77_9CAUD|nr:hypothetical protein UFOVP473_63 [uncultured Caudovirales phage]CAB4176859.1 hypothetical protein UFOVP983_63 [uncultured Caudovirales phage]CAB4190022.1 hypothetical protein UFOVP1204_38 [uncultured Caudovirales phage]